MRLRGAGPAVRGPRATPRESRHALGRRVGHGRRGEPRQRRIGATEDRFGALGPVLDRTVVWNTVYTAAVTNQRHRAAARGREPLPRAGGTATAAVARPAWRWSSTDSRAASSR
ncbi:Tn3 family transposase [Nocardiopsis alborubida]|uniref:Tn3 family transposase n=1 Tax=Nocardiopsis alborubida TaxID=146802 RepID=A0A7X6MIC8_9ACTN|nr:Tn3 family transposase [Nocardiopsis alborubida]